MFRLLTFSAIALIGTIRCDAGIVYGITNSDLIRIDSQDPTNAIVVGSHNLWRSNTRNLIRLAWDSSENRLLSIRYDLIEGGARMRQTIVSINPLTAVGTELTNVGAFVIGDFSDARRTESIEFLPNRGYIVSRPNGRNGNTGIDDLDIVSGNSRLIVDAGHDVDFLTRDPFGDDLLTMDAGNGLGLFATDFSTGASINLSPINHNGGLTGDLTKPGVFYTLDQTNNEFLRIDIDGGTSASFTSLGEVPGDTIHGLAAVSAVPEPSTSLFFLVGSVFVALKRRHRKSST